jgi:lipoprotein-anchoring transpeptidase ErfK/SrfK
MMRPDPFNQRAMSMTRAPILVLAAIAASLGAHQALANDRYGDRPPLVVSPDLSAPWVMQLQRAPLGVRHRDQVRGGLPGVRVTVAPAPRRRDAAPDPMRTAAVGAGQPRDGLASAAPSQSSGGLVDPRFLPQIVDYSGPHEPGTIVIDTRENLLYLVETGGKARRYGVGTGKPGFEWAGTHRVTMKREWPDWRPPAEMIARERQKGRILPVHMAGGPANPLGARALYLGSTLYRIHGTNQPETIGGAVSSGCIRMRNEDVIDLYERVGVGTRVVVI